MKYPSACLSLAYLFMVAATAYEAPFQTSADMRIYFTDTHGVVHGDGEAALFRYRNIKDVFVAGKSLPVLNSGHNWIQVDLPPGEHEVRIQTSDPADQADVAPRPMDAKAIQSADEFKARAKVAKPGDTLVLRDGIYANWTVSIPCQGTEDKPITIRPETPGGVMFRLKTRVTLSGDWITFRGFRFEHSDAYTLRIAGGCDNRITQCQFFHCGSPGSTFGHIVSIDVESHRNRVDHCYWTGSKSMSLGQRNISNEPEKVGTHNRFDHNIFRDIIRLWINGQENIQIGQGVPWTAEPRTIVEYNLFDNAWGDGEIMSSKTSRNLIRRNVAAHCTHSAFTLRGGDHTVFDSNIIYRCGGGVRVYGRHHQITNNLILDCDGSAVAFQIGHKRGKSEGFPATNCLIAHNTFVNNGGGVSAAGPTDRDDWRPRGNKIVNNLFTAFNGIFISPDGHLEPQVERNLFWTSGNAVTGIEGRDAVLDDPLLTGERAEIGLSPRSPAIDHAAALDAVKHDRHGNPRPWGKASDLGADESVSEKSRRKNLRMPLIPEAPMWSIDHYKGSLACTQDPESPLDIWEMAEPVVASNGAVEIEGGVLPFSGKLPADFVMEWEYQPETFAAKGSIVFSGTVKGEDEGYRLTWGGVEKDGKPSGLISLYKNGKLIAECADTVYYRRNYIPSFPNNMVAIRGDRPNPQLWYHCRLIKWRGMIRLILNTAERTSEGKPRNVRDVPVMIWEDTGDISGPVLDGGKLAVSQEGPGRWRNLRIWRAEYLGDVPPPAPAEVKAKARNGGCITLSWRHEGQAGRRCFFDVFRGDTAAFSPCGDNQVAWRVEGNCFHDFDVKPGRPVHYQVRAVNALGVCSPAATVDAAGVGRESDYLLIEAGAPVSIELPMALDVDEYSGQHILIAAEDSGDAMEKPPEKGHAVYEFIVPEDGKYRLWVSAIAPGSGSNSFWAEQISLKGGGSRILHLAESDRWAWRPLTGPVDLRAGSHQVRLMPRESGAMLNRILITDDLDWTPATSHSE